MPRTLRVEIEGGLYHVYNRIGNELHPFANDVEAEIFVDLVRDVTRRDQVTVFAWCLMSNHYHLVLRTRLVPLSRSMRSIQHRYSLGFNRRRGSKGPVWQDRYQAKLLADQRYFNQAMAYVHLNPVTAGMVDDPAMYRLSGHLEVLGKTNDPMVDVDQALMSFGDSLKSARSAYVKALKGVEIGVWEGERVDRLEWWRKKDDRELQPTDTGPYVDELGRSTGLDRPLIDVSEFVQKAGELLDVQLVELGGRGRLPRLVRKRELIAVVAVERYGISVQALAEFLGKHRVTVSSWVNRGARLRQKSRSFRARVDSLDRYLAGC